MQPNCSFACPRNPAVLYCPELNNLRYSLMTYLFIYLFKYCYSVNCTRFPKWSLAKILYTFLICCTRAASTAHCIVSLTIIMLDGKQKHLRFFITSIPLLGSAYTVVCLQTHSCCDLTKIRLNKYRINFRKFGKLI